MASRSRRRSRRRARRGGSGGKAEARAGACDGHLALVGVNFSYPARPERRVLFGFNLDVKPGETVALVGPSGGVRASVINLIERFYAPPTAR